MGDAILGLALRDRFFFFSYSSPLEKVPPLLPLDKSGLEGGLKMWLATSLPELEKKVKRNRLSSPQCCMLSGEERVL